MTTTEGLARDIAAEVAPGFLDPEMIEGIIAIIEAISEAIMRCRDDSQKDLMQAIDQETRPRRRRRLERLAYWRTLRITRRELGRDASDELVQSVAERVYAHRQLLPSILSESNASQAV